MTSMRSRWVERMTEREVHRKVLHEDDPDAMAVSDEEVRDYCYDDRVVKHVTPVAMLGVGGVAVFRLYAAADASATGVCGPDSDLTLEAIFPHFLSSFFSMITTALFWHKGFAGFVKRHYHTICACQLGQLYIMTLASETLIALQRRNVATCAPGPQNAEDSPVWVVLMCGKEMGKYVSIFSSCAMFSMNRAATAKMCTISCVAFVVANVVLGAPPGLILLCTLFQLGVGLSAGYLSNGHLAGLQAEYYASKITRFATEQARDILCTLLPYNVLTKLEAPGGEKLLGTSSSVPAACILFVHTSCVQEQATATDHRSVIAAHAAARNARTLAGSADQGMASQKQFEFLHTMFCKWDTLVERAGAFKYQHVNEWYIVACPRAANPHDDDMQRQPYPQDYVTKMAILAEKILQAATDGNASTPSTGMRIAVKAGIHLGPVAGVVLGKQRSFYALYGDSVNVAARMAQSAAPGKLLASKPFADNLMAPPGVAGAPFVCESQGFKHVKGLGDVESFNVTWKVQHGNQDAATGACLPASTNPVAPSRERRGSLSDVLKRTWSGSVRDTQHLHGCPFVAEHTKAGESAGSQRRTRHSTASFESSTAGEHEWGPMEVAASGDKTANCRAINETGNGGLGAATERWLHWLQNGRFKSSGWVGGFPRPLEREFVGFMCGRQGRTETRGLSILLHMVALALQWRFTLLVHETTPGQQLPNPPAALWEREAGEAPTGGGLGGDSPGGSDHVTWVRARSVLEVHLVVNLLLSCVALACIHQPQRALAREGSSGRIVGGWLSEDLVANLIVGSKVMALSVSVGINRVLPEAFDEWMAIFFLGFTGAACMTSGLPFKHNVIVCAAVCTCVVPFTLSRGSDWGVKMHGLLVVGVLTAASLIMTFFFDQALRAQFRLYVVFRLERRRVREILLNLLPRDIANRMLRHAGRLPSDVRRAVVLQLDLCNFTTFSKSVEPSELASVMHRVFSEFDQALAALGGLNKLDTVGDAYLVAAFLTGSEWADGPDEESHAACSKMKLLAVQMQHILAEMRTATGYPLHARIGIAIGDVAAGVMGRLQPRFLLLGPALASAEAHEKLCPVDSILLSEPFFLQMRGFGKVDDQSSGSSADYEGDGSDADEGDLSDDQQLAPMAGADESEPWESKIEGQEWQGSGRSEPGCELGERLHYRFQALQRHGNRVYERATFGGTSTSANSASATFISQHRELPEMHLPGSLERREGGGGAEGGYNGEGARGEARETGQAARRASWDWLSKATPALLSSEDVGSGGGAGSAELSRESDNTESGRGLPRSVSGLSQSRTGSMSRTASHESMAYTASNESMETSGVGINCDLRKPLEADGISRPRRLRRKRVKAKVSSKVRVVVCSCSTCRKLPAASASG